MNLRTKKSRFVLGAVASLIVVAAVAGIASAGGSLTFSELVDHPQAPVASVPTSIASSFRIFGSPSRVAVPSAAKPQIIDLSYGKSLGVNADLARAVSSTVTASPIIVVPGADGMCVFVPDPVDGYAVSCGKTDDVKSRGLVAELGAGDNGVVAVLLPDGVKSVTLNGPGGSRSVAASSNVVVTTKNGATSVDVAGAKSPLGG